VTVRGEARSNQRNAAAVPRHLAGYMLPPPPNTPDTEYREFPMLLRGNRRGMGPGPGRFLPPGRTASATRRRAGEPSTQFIRLRTALYTAHRKGPPINRGAGRNDQPYEIVDHKRGLNESDGLVNMLFRVSPIKSSPHRPRDPRLQSLARTRTVGAGANIPRARTGLRLHKPGPVPSLQEHCSL